MMTDRLILRQITRRRGGYRIFRLGTIHSLIYLWSLPREWGKSLVPVFKVCPKITASPERPCDIIFTCVGHFSMSIASALYLYAFSIPNTWFLPTEA